jgi:anti-sigma-K factor RskA
MTERSQIPSGPDDVSELLGAYVLDAVDEFERRRVERAADADPEVAAEIESLLIVVDGLTDAVAVDPPAGLWDSIRSGVDDDNRRNGSVSSVKGLSDAPGPVGPRSNRSFFLAAAAAVVAVLVISGSVVIGLSGSTPPTDSIATMTAMANDAATRPGTRTGVLSDPEGSMEIRVIVDVEGRGFMMTDPLPALPFGETYQLWSAANGTMVSLGMLGSDPEMSLVSIDASVTELALTREPAQGSVAPTSSPMATGLLA